VLLSAAGAVAIPACSLIVEPDPDKLHEDGGGGGAIAAGGGQGGGTAGAPLGGGGATAGGGGQGGDGGQGGHGSECDVPADCPGADTECRSRTCDAGVCGFVDEDAGVPLARQTEGDCLVAGCDGAGATTVQDDDSDILDDGNDCTDDVCSAGVPENNPKPLDTVCSTGGGAFCNATGSCVECNDGTECPSGVCTLEHCVPASCTNGIVDSGETDTDCGGPDCAPCADGDACEVAGDCQSGVCDALVCAAPACDDGVDNGDETDVDCGGATCSPCGPGDGCLQDSDCVGGSCSGTVCLPTCTDSVTNGNETDTDCGGPICGGCAVGDTCAVGTDCLTLSCPAGVCAQPTCTDNATNGDETDTDCGGPDCPDCGPGDHCLVPGDCASGICNSNTCASAGCGDGVLQAGEACDDGNTSGGDGCSGGCTVENGYSCTGTPSTCSTTCSDGIVAGTEACDDGGSVNGDGCSSSCAIESGWSCTGSPSTCSPTCGDGAIHGGETCDDGDATGGDGCSATCHVEPGFTCVGAPSTCTADCGDGFVAGAETCDDGDTTGGDGCSATCAVETGWSCVGAPSSCSTTCGDGIIVGAESCDDNDAVGGDGCSASCAVELGWVCTGTPSTCVPFCGDGLVTGGEACDDSNTTPGDGCSATCAVETGWSCVGAPSACAPTCGDGQKVGAEGCDDGNVANGDCCSSSCQIEAGCEIEPNNACGQENAITLSGSPPTGTVKGSINPAAEGDFYTFTLPGPGVSSVKLETFFGTLGTCASSSNNDTFIELRGTDCTTILLSDDDDSAGWCSLIDPSTIPADTAATNLAPGTYHVRVRHSSTGSPVVLANYSLQVTVLSTCGDNVIGPTENCDDGNTVSGDGCSSSCKVEYPLETESNNTCATANGPIAVPTTATGAIVAGSITPAADQDWFTFTIPVRADVRFETFDSSGPSTCASIDTVLQVFQSDCVTPLGAAQDQGGVGSCSRIDPQVLGYARQLAPGSYKVKVNAFSASATFNYTVQVRMTSQCGNNVTEGFEQCDGGPTCAADCTLLAVCGNGTVQSGETCDDGNTVSGDGCSAACGVEAGYGCAGTPSLCTPVCGDSTILAPEACDGGDTSNGDGCDSACATEQSFAEVEPNDTIAGADTNAAGGLVANGTSTMFAGALAPTGDKDIYKVVLATSEVVHFETFDSSGNDCTAAAIPATMRLTLFDAAGVTLKTDTLSGIGSCAALSVFLTAGTYYIQVDRSTAGTLAAYKLQVKVLGSRGSEVEPNDTNATARGIPGTDVYVFGGHQVTTDLDTYAVFVPAGKSLRVETVEGSTAETCESNGIDSRIRIINSAGTDLGNDDDGGRGFCSLIDGTGASPANGYAHNLAAGIYYVRVESTSTATGAANQFDYRLVVTVR